MDIRNNMSGKKKNKKPDWGKLLRESTPLGHILRKDTNGYPLLHFFANQPDNTCPSMIQKVGETLSSDAAASEAFTHSIHNQTPIITAICERNYIAFEQLLIWGHTLSLPLDPAWLDQAINFFEADYLIEIVFTKHIAIATPFLQHPDYSQSILRSVVCEKHNPRLLQKLLTLGTPMESVVGHFHLLSYAIQHKLYDIVHCFINYLPTRIVHARDQTDTTPLEHACIEGDLVCVDAILFNHAYPPATNKNGCTILHKLACVDTWLPEHEAIIQRLLTASVCPKQVNNDGNNPAMLALMHNNIALAVQLLPSTPLNIFNKEGYHILFIALLFGHYTFAQTIVSKESFIVDKPFFLLQKTCTHPKRSKSFRNLASQNSSLKKVLDILKHPSLPEAFSSISLCIALKPYIVEISSIFSILLSIFACSDQRTLEDDPVFIAIKMQQFIIAKVLLRYGVPISTLAVDAAQHATEERLPPQEIQALRGVKELVSIHQLFLAGETTLGYQACYNLALESLPVHWILDHWEALSEHFLLLCFEHPNRLVSYQSLIFIIQQRRLSPYSILDRYSMGANAITLQNSLEALICYFEQEKIINRLSTPDKNTLVRLGYNIADKKSPCKLFSDMQITTHLERSLPSITHVDPDDTVYKQWASTWRVFILDKIQSEQPLEDPDTLSLVDIFCIMLNDCMLKKLFNENIHNPPHFIQGLILLHMSPCSATRVHLMQLILNIVQTVEPARWSFKSLFATNAQHDNNMVGEIFNEIAQQRNLSEDELIRISALMFIHTANQNTSEANNLFRFMLKFIILPTCLFSSPVYLLQWLSCYDREKLNVLDDVTTQLVILTYCEENYTNPAYSSIVLSIFNHLAPFISMDITDQLFDHSEVVYLLSKPNYLSVLRNYCKDLATEIYEYVQFTICANHKRLDSSDFSLINRLEAQADAQKDASAQLKELHTSELDELSKKYAHTKKELTSTRTKHRTLQDQYSTLEQDYRAIKTREDDALEKVVTFEHSIQYHAEKADVLTAQITSLQENSKQDQQTLDKLRKDLQKKQDTLTSLQQMYNQLQTDHQSLLEASELLVKKPDCDIAVGTSYPSLFDASVQTESTSVDTKSIQVQIPSPSVSIDNSQLLFSSYLLSCYHDIQPILTHTIATITPIAALSSIESIHWVGTGAIELARLFWHKPSSIDFLTCFSDFAEDIDIKICCEDPHSVKNLVIQMFSMSKIYHIQSTTNAYHINLRCLTNNLVYNITFNTRANRLTHVTDIAWIWQPSINDWRISFHDLKPLQYAFLSCQSIPVFFDAGELCTFYWSVHQLTKHHALNKPLSCAQALMYATYNCHKGTSQCDHVLLSLLKKFNKTPYWQHIVHILFYYQITLDHGISAPMVTLLLPKGASFPVRLDSHRVGDLLSCDSLKMFLSRIKTLWVEYEPNAELLQYANAVDWCNITTHSYVSKR